MSIAFKRNYIYKYRSLFKFNLPFCNKKKKPMFGIMKVEGGMSNTNSI